MTDFLVMHRPEGSESDVDFRPTLAFTGRKSDEVEQVIREAATEGPGEYMAVPLGYCTRKVASGLSFSDPGEEGAS